MFRTPINLEHLALAKQKIDYQSNVLLTGSCFVENIGQRLAYHKFNTLINPYGILFHPLAILKLFQDVKNSHTYTDKDLVFHNELWQSMQHHSDLSHPNKSIALEHINRSIKTTKLFLQQATHIIVTLGTAWVYYFIEQDTLVANCHKIPANRFTKRLLSLDEIQSGLLQIVILINELSPKADIIFTLSPVRHLRDGMTDNMQSKARLLTAIHQVINQTDANYFPSYEIMMDDLRDYRFYADDMLHPNTTAINYIWSLFKELWVDKNIEPVMSKVNKVQKGLLHKPNFPDTEAHQKFTEQLNKLKQDLKTNHSIDF